MTRNKGTITIIFAMLTVLVLYGGASGQDEYKLNYNLFNGEFDLGPREVFKVLDFDVPAGGGTVTGTFLVYEPSDLDPKPNVEVYVIDGHLLEDLLKGEDVKNHVHAESNGKVGLVDVKLDAGHYLLVFKDTTKESISVQAKFRLD